MLYKDSLCRHYTVNDQKQLLQLLTPTSRLPRHLVQVVYLNTEIDLSTYQEIQTFLSDNTENPSNKSRGLFHGCQTVRLGFPWFENMYGLSDPATHPQLANHQISQEALDILQAITCLTTQTPHLRAHLHKCSIGGLLTSLCYDGGWLSKRHDLGRRTVIRTSLGILLANRNIKSLTVFSLGFRTSTMLTAAGSTCSITLVQPCPAKWTSRSGGDHSSLLETSQTVTIINNNKHASTSSTIPGATYADLMDLGWEQIVQ